MSETVIAPSIQLPIEAQKRVVRELGNFSVPLNFADNPIGSGTLVKFENKYAILTASHVILRISG